MEAFDEGRVGPGEFRIRLIFDGFIKDGTRVNFDHYHDAVITGLGAARAFSGLVSEDGVAGVVHFGEDVALLVALELQRPEILQWGGFVFGEAYILPGLVEVTLWHFNFFGIKLLHITRSEEQPTNKFPAWTTLSHVDLTG